MFLGNTRTSSNVNVGAGAQPKVALPTVATPVLGPTATANVNLGGVQGGQNPYAQYQPTTGNQLSPPVQNNWNKPPQGAPQQGNFPTNNTPGQQGFPQNQGYPQNQGLVQPVSGPGPQNNMKPQGPTQPGPFSQQDNKNSFSTAQTSKNASTAGPVSTQTRQALPPGQKENGVKQSGPGLAITTNFKGSCDTTPKPNNPGKVIIPWDHGKQNYVYTDQAFDMMKSRVTKDQVKTVRNCNS